VAQYVQELQAHHLSRRKRDQFAASNLRHFALAVARDYRIGAAYRLRKPRESDACPSKPARAGNGRTVGARSFALEVDPAIAVGRICACWSRRGSGYRIGGDIQQELSELSQYRKGSHSAGHQPGVAGVALYPGCDDFDMRFFFAPPPLFV